LDDSPLLRARTAARERLSRGISGVRRSRPAGAGSSIHAAFGDHGPIGNRIGQHVLEVFQPRTGGVPRYAAALAQGLVANGWRVSVACPADAWVCNSLRASEIEMLPIEVGRSPKPWEDIVAIRKIRQWCAERNVALIHGHSTKAGLLAALAGRAANVPSVFTPHGWTFEMHVAPPLRVAYALYERQLAHRYHAALLTVSRSGRDAAERWRVAPRGRIQVVGTGLPTMPDIGRGPARRKLGLPTGVIAAWVGRTGLQKRAEDLAAIARTLGDEVTVLALCDGIHGTPLASELRAAGVVLADPGCDPATIYSAADMVLHTSRWEGSPLVVLEAMSASLPVVAYAVGGVPEQVQAGRTGQLVGPGDTEMMCVRVRALARNPELRVRMGQAGHERALRVFSHSAMLERITRAYRAVIGSTEPLDGISTHNPEDAFADLVGETPARDGVSAQEPVHVGGYAPVGNRSRPVADEKERA
jgi:glycosyltransferase involved in cell wall biosynthesis